MNTVFSLAYQVRKEREWAAKQAVPGWDMATRQHGVSRHRLARIVLVLLILAMLGLGAMDATSGSAHSLPRCVSNSSAQPMSVRTSNLPRFRMISGQPLMPNRCWHRPGDPVNQNLAIRAFQI